MIEANDNIVSSWKSIATAIGLFDTSSHDETASSDQMPNQAHDLAVSARHGVVSLKLPITRTNRQKNMARSRHRLAKASSQSRLRVGGSAFVTKSIGVLHLFRLWSRDHRDSPSDNSFLRPLLTKSKLLSMMASPSFFDGRWLQSALG